MKHLFSTSLFLIALLVGIQNSQAQLGEKFNVTVRGSLDDQKGLKDYNNVRVAILWHSDDINLENSKKWNISPATSTVDKKGKFKFTLTQAPPLSSCIVTRRFALAIGFIVAFDDANQNQKLDKEEKILGLSEKHAMSFVRGNYIKGLNAFEKDIKKRIVTLRKLKNGIWVNKVVPKEIHKLPNTGFDDLTPIKKKKIKVKVVIPKKLNDLNAPNWT
ncbi:hypothetical protein BKI52_01015 [marine bacterium AO1-C]|nr:hypothetical protein BKI52_01015 [marine bacterium AO1-C]